MQKKGTKLLHRQKMMFQERANRLIDIAYSADPSKALSLLEKRNQRFGSRNLMQLGYIGHLRNFIASECLSNVVLNTKESISPVRPDMPERGSLLLAARLHPAAVRPLPRRPVLPIHHLDLAGQVRGKP